ncbi:o-succinylbenzoate--CoA ligase [Rhodothermus profundi]|uniref:2-succinylbenzoyl-CoA synthetase n=1 Tax=Rhodothermus profundi TaxID=633813 RepID=A0A1M6Q734_9BACT|nr:o-succinylbenzoate--CoA ligase [Rhodothermus profundi]SHK15935.1 2-succinylbenzoyl-CoA synthetase [Rhodothermus profundi]
MSTRNLICPLFQWSSRAPDQPVIWLASGPLTAGALEHRVRRILARLQQEGVGRGDRIGIWLDDPVATIACMLALWRLQAVACLLSTRTPPGGLATLIQQVGLQALITDRPVQPAVPCWSPETLQTGAPVVGADIPRLALEQEATIFFTSGSTGTPKGVLHTLRNHLYSARGVAQHVQLRAGDRWLLVLPLYHVGGMGVVIRCLLVGAAVVIPERQEPLEQALTRYEPTHVSLVHTQLWRLLRDFRDAPPRALRVVLLGGSAIPEDVLQEGVARRWPLLTSYGLTEMASTVTATPPGASLALLRTSGQVLPYRALKIGPDGSIQVRGAVRFAGYLENGQLRRPFEQGGWFDTGDLGWVDEKGLLHVEGRRDNRFISGGENIQPEAIERALQRLPGVAEAMVVPVPDPEFGERPAAFVRLSDSAPWTPERWRAQLRRELPGFMVPVAFWRWPEGVEAGLKVARRRLQEEARRRWQSPGKVHRA